MLKRKTTAQTDRKKKISLPAALFNRSPLKNAENSSMISNTSFVNETACENHPNKRGKYAVISQQIEEDQQTYYCEKCAILLASKGFEVKKLDGQDGVATEKKKSNPRELQLNNFIKQVQSKIKLLKEGKKQSAQQLSEIEQVYESKLQRIDIFFEQLYTLLEKYKNKQGHEINLRKKAYEQQLATYLGYVTQKVQLLENMKQDIVSSQQSIITETPQQDYRLVMSHYKANLQEIKCQPSSANFEELPLPAIDSLQGLLSQFFEGNRGTCFSFDSLSKKPYE